MASPIRSPCGTTVAASSLRTTRPTYPKPRVCPRYRTANPVCLPHTTVAVARTCSPSMLVSVPSVGCGHRSRCACLQPGVRPQAVCARRRADVATRIGSVATRLGFVATHLGSVAISLGPAAAVASAELLRWSTLKTQARWTWRTTARSRRPPSAAGWTSAAHTHVLHCKCSTGATTGCGNGRLP